jgi:hypothetical protein
LFGSHQDPAGELVRQLTGIQHYVVPPAARIAGSWKIAMVVERKMQGKLKTGEKQALFVY